MQSKYNQKDGCESGDGSKSRQEICWACVTLLKRVYKIGFVMKERKTKIHVTTHFSIGKVSLLKKWKLVIETDKQRYEQTTEKTMESRPINRSTVAFAAETE
jgi:hypothetical protein